MNIFENMQQTIAKRQLANANTPIMLMVSGGSDSTALAYAAADLRKLGALGPLAIFHLNHQLRGEDADADEAFVGQLAALLDVPFFCERIDIGALASAERVNIEAVARRERYGAAKRALAQFCTQLDLPAEQGRLFTAHTVDDRIENFYMRSIVGTGPGGFRSMRYLNGQIARPLLECGREELRCWLQERAAAGEPCVRDAAGNLWRNDATNETTDRFRTYVRHEIIPAARARNAQLAETLTRTMNLIADEDDLLDNVAATLEEQHVRWEQSGETAVLLPALATEPLPLLRRVCVHVLKQLLPEDARVETASVNAVLTGFAGENGSTATMNSGYVTNIQGNLAISANKRGVRIEPMEAFRARRKRK